MRGLARECVDLGEARGIVVHRGNQWQRTECELVEVLAAVRWQARELAGLDVRFEPGRVCEASGRERRIGELEDDPRGHRGL